LQRIFVSLLSILTISATSQDYSHEIISYITNCEIKNNKLLTEIQILIQINNREGDKITRINIPFTRSNKIVDLSAQIVDSQGNIIRKLRNNDAFKVRQKIPKLQQTLSRALSDLIHQ